MVQDYKGLTLERLKMPFPVGASKASMKAFCEDLGRALVPGEFDPRRPKGIIDVTLLTLNPDTMNAESLERLLQN